MKNVPVGRRGTDHRSSRRKRNPTEQYQECLNPIIQAPLFLGLLFILGRLGKLGKRIIPYLSYLPYPGRDFYFVKSTVDTVTSPKTVTNEFMFAVRQKV